VTSGDFYKSVVEAVEKRVVGLLAIEWKTKRSGVTEFIIPSARTLADAIQEVGSDQDIGILKDFMGKPRGWLQAFKSMRADPQRFHDRALDASDFAWDFDECCAWNRSFRVLYPIKDRVLAREQLLAMENTGCNPLPSPRWLVML
jgi:hypothetical protein